MAHLLAKIGAEQAGVHRFGFFPFFQLMRIRAHCQPTTLSPSNGAMSSVTSGAVNSLPEPAKDEYPDAENFRAIDRRLKPAGQKLARAYNIQWA
ncbi:hypothetical protein ACNKHL_15915 [Shigella flexneri]